MPNPDPSAILRSARLAAGLSQRAVAQRAGTAQSVVARIELGLASPSFATLSALLMGAGFELRTRIEPLPVIGDHMLDDVARILKLTPEARLMELGNADRFFAAAERV